MLQLYTPSNREELRILRISSHKDSISHDKHDRNFENLLITQAKKDIPTERTIDYFKYIYNIESLLMCKIASTFFIIFFYIYAVSYI